MSLTRFHTNIKELSLLQSSWTAVLDPLLGDPTNDNILLTGTNNAGIPISSSTPTIINHLLGRMQQGWIITDLSSNAVVWRTSPFNDKTLTLQSSSDTTIKLMVY